MRNLLLNNQAIDIVSLSHFEYGINKLNKVCLEKEQEKDVFYKDPDIWNYQFSFGYLGDLFGNIELSDEFKNKLLPVFFGREFTSIPIYCDNEIDFNTIYPEDCNGFLGIDFQSLEIKSNRKVNNLDSYYNFKRNCILNSNTFEYNEIMYELNFLYPNYSFDKRAIEDIIDIKKRGNEYHRLHELLFDIAVNPFTGGIGKTESLKNKQGASKRLTDGDRIVYIIKRDCINILQCLGHYDDN